MALIGLILIVSATFGGLLGFSGLAAAEPAKATIQGLVENELGQGLEDVTVVAFNPDAGGSFRSVETDEGEFLIANLDPGHYLVRFTHPDYLSHIVFAQVNPGEKFQLEETLEMVNADDLTMELTGFVEDDSGTPIEDALVMLLDDNGNLGTTYYGTPMPHHYLQETDAFGAYKFEGLYNGSFQLRVSADGYYTEVSPVVVNNHTEANVTLDEVAFDNYIKIYVEDDQSLSIDPNTVDVVMYEYATGTWTAGEKGTLSHKFWPRDGDHLFVATAIEEGQYLSGSKEVDVDGRDSYYIPLADWEPMDRDYTYDFIDWTTFTSTVSHQLTFDDGRTIDANPGKDLLEPMTGLISFDVDRIWGDNDGTAQMAEFEAYAAWEQALDAGMTYTEEFLKVKDDNLESYTYDPDTFTYELTQANGDPLADRGVSSTAGFRMVTTADYTAQLDDMDNYEVKCLIPNQSETTHDLSFNFDWPDDFETTANTTNKTSGAVVTGTPNTLIIPGEAPEAYENVADGWVTLTVTQNELPTPVIDILTSLNQVEYLDSEDELVKVWVVNSTTQVNFTAEDSSDPQKILNYTWTFNGALAAIKYGEEVNNTFDALPQDNTNATITLTLSDAHAQNGTTVDIYVDDTAPTAIFNMTVKHAAGADGEPYAFNATDGSSNLDEKPSNDVLVFDAGNSTDAGFLGQNAIISYDWLFSDNETFDGPVISRGFEKPGDYTVTLTVTDAAHNQHAMSDEFFVNDIEAPEAAYTWCGYNETNNCTPEAGFVGRPFEFNASKTEDNSGVVTSYTWDVTKSADDVVDRFTIEEFLFTIVPMDYEGDLADGPVPADITDIFDDNGITLEDGAMLTRAVNEFASLLDETHWRIETDTGIYTLKDNGTEVKVYSDDPGDDAVVVFITFLEYKDEGYSVTLTVTDGSDNDAQYMRTINPARPDLPDLFSPNIVMTPEAVEEGDTVTFEVDIKLLGRNLTDSFHVSFYKDEIGANNQLENLTVTPEEINGADERTITLTVTWKKPAPGDRRFIVFVDSVNEIFEGALDEKVETNNQQITPFFVTETEDDGTNVLLIAGILGVVAFLGIAGYYFFVQRPGFYDDE